LQIIIQVLGKLGTFIEKDRQEVNFLNQDGLLSADFARGKRNPAETVSGSGFPDSAYAFCVRKRASKPF